MEVPARTRTRARTVAFAVCVAGLAVFIATVPLRPRIDSLLGAGTADQVIDFGLFNLIYLAAAAVFLLCREGITTRERTGWWLLAGSMLISAVGNAYLTLVLADLPEVPYPSLADLLWLCWYPLSYVAIILVLTARVGRFPLSVWLDGLVAGAAAAALAAAIWFKPLTESDPGTPLATVVVNMAYPVFDLLLLCMLVGLGYMVRLAARGWLVLLGIGFLATTVADVVAAIQAVDGGYVEGGWVDPVWLVGVVALAGASLTRRRVTAVDALALLTQRSGGSLRVMAVPMGGAAASLVLLQAGQGERFPPVAGIFAGICILGAGLRASLTFRDLARLANVHREARTDDLTRLANRRALYEVTEQTLAAADRVRTPTSLLLIDLDGFKEVNDSLGHAVGDELLVAFADRLQSVMRPGDLLARLGGDEFAVLAPVTSLAEAELLAWEVVSSTLESYQVGEVRLSVGASVGVSTLPPGAGARGDLLRQADIAMYQAKGSPRRVSAFQAGIGGEDDSGAARLALLMRLREGLAPAGSRSSRSGHVELHIQPKISLTDGRLDGVEALARWRDHDGVLLFPGEFLPLVQRGGLLPALAVDVLSGAVRIARQLRDAGVDAPVAVNLTAVDLHDISLPDRVRTLLGEAGIDPSALVVELTEDSLVIDSDATARVLSNLREIGVRVSLDDFGTGYSSLAYLRRLPVDEVKLDRSFTVGVGDDPAADAVIAHTVGLVHALGLHLVAEGVEDAATARRLRELGCDSGQGYLWAYPAPVEDFLTSRLAQDAAQAVRGTAELTA